MPFTVSVDLVLVSCGRVWRSKQGKGKAEFKKMSLLFSTWFLQIEFK